MRKSVKTTGGLSQEAAQEIIGRDSFLGLGESREVFGISPSNGEMKRIYRVPFTEEELEGRSDTHILALVFPISPSRAARKDVRNRRYLHHILYEECLKWEGMELFMQDCGPRWVLLYKKAKHHLHTWEEQLELLEANEKVPPASVLLCIAIEYAIVTGRILFEGSCIRCRDTINGGSIVISNYGREYKALPYCDDYKGFVGIATEIVPD